MEFRKAREEDLERLVEIHLAAYPDDRNAEARKRNLTHNRFGALDDLIVAVEGDEILAHAFLFRMRAWFGGVSVKMGGIASVGVAPEARGRGVGAALMDQLHVLSDTRGDALTMLYAFRHGYYAPFGYTTTSSLKRLAFDPRSVPDSWRALARDRIRNARGPDGAGIRNVHARNAARASGWMTRSKTFWERFFSQERRLLLVCDGSASPASSSSSSSSKSKRRAMPISGYVAFSLLQEHPHAETIVEVDELVADDDESRRALFGALSAMRDQVAEIVIDIAEDDPLERALIDPDGHRYGTERVEHAFGDIVGGPMIRIEDIPRALAARGYMGNGAFDVVVRAAAAEGHQGQQERGVIAPARGSRRRGQAASSQPQGAQEDIIAVGVRVHEGRAEIGPARGGGALRTTRAGLAAIFYGGLPVNDAIALGLADVDHARVASRIDAIARLAPLTPLDAF